MNRQSNVTLIVALVALAIAIGGLFALSSVSSSVSQLNSQLSVLTGDQAPEAGASTPGTRFPHGVTIGLPAYSPTNLALVLSGTCTSAITGTTLPLVATSSIAATCPVSGVLAGDIVNVGLTQFAAKSSIWGGFVVNGATASTDTITFNYFNETGASTSSFPAATSSAVTYQVWRAQ